MGSKELILSGDSGPRASRSQGAPPSGVRPNSLVNKTLLTSLSHRRRNSKDARDVSVLVGNAAMEPRRCARYLASKVFYTVHLFSVCCAHVRVSSLHHPTTRRITILWCATNRYQRKSRAVPPVRASSCPQSTLVCEDAVFGTVSVKTIRNI